MVDYKNGKIYALVSRCNKKYVGSTCQTLARRRANHKAYSNHYANKPSIWITSAEIFKIDPEAKIILLEAFPCNNNDELKAREQYWIENTECVNKIRAIRTEEQIKEQNREDSKRYELAHRDERNAKKREKVQCPHCNAEVNRCGLARHIRRNHTENGNKIKCPHCDVELDRNGLARHIKRKHTI